MQCLLFPVRPAVWVLRPSPFLKNVSGGPGAPKPDGRERRFPVFARLVEAFPEIPEESKPAHFGSASPARHPARQAPCFSSENQRFNPNFFGRLLSKSPTRIPEDPSFLCNRRSGRCSVASRAAVAKKELRSSGLVATACITARGAIRQIRSIRPIRVTKCWGRPDDRGAGETRSSRSIGRIPRCDSEGFPVGCFANKQPQKSLTRSRGERGDAGVHSSSPVSHTLAVHTVKGIHVLSLRLRVSLLLRVENVRSRYFGKQRCLPEKASTHSLNCS